MFPTASLSTISEFSGGVKAEVSASVAGKAYQDGESGEDAAAVIPCGLTVLYGMRSLSTIFRSTPTNSM